MQMTQDTHLPDLSPREMEVLKWTACGKTCAEISSFLDLSEETIRSQIKSLCKKLNASNKTQAIAVALTHGILSFKPSPKRVIPLTTLLGLSKYPVAIPSPQPSRRTTQNKKARYP